MQLLFTHGCRIEIHDDQHYGLFKQSRDPKEIAVYLNQIGVRFEQWEASQPLPANPSEAEVKEAYKVDIEKVQRENGYQSIDVFRLTRN